MRTSIAIYGNAYQDTILTVSTFPIENQANEILNYEFRAGGIHNVYRALSKLDQTQQNQLIAWKQSAATILYNLSNSQRTSLVKQIHEKASAPWVTDADWHHVCYIDDLELDLAPLLEQMKRTGKISMDFCKRGAKLGYLALLKYADFVFCSTEDCMDNDLLLSQLDDHTFFILHDKTGSRSFQANKIRFEYQTRVLDNVNPLGAGDAFAAACIHGFMQGHSLELAVARAHEFATQNIVEGNHE